MTNSELQFIDALILQVSEMVVECGRADGFDVEQWTNTWIRAPLPALNNQTPLSLIGSIEGQRIVANLLATTKSGTYL